MNIEIKKKAQRELRAVEKYISRDSKFYADKTVFEIKQRILNLSYFPEMGKQVVVNEKVVRQIIYKSYKIFYKINSNNIYILSIFHHSRDVSNLKL